MRCPDCARLLSFAFVSDKSGEYVYQCRTVGVPVYATDKAGRYRMVTMTADHQDRFYVASAYGLLRVVPVEIGKAKRKDFEGRAEWYALFHYEAHKSEALAA